MRTSPLVCSALGDVDHILQVDQVFDRLLCMNPARAGLAENVLPPHTRTLPVLGIDERADHLSHHLQSCRLFALLVAQKTRSTTVPILGQRTAPLKQPLLRYLILSGAGAGDREKVGTLPMPSQKYRSVMTRPTGFYQKRGEVGEGPGRTRILLMS